MVKLFLVLAMLILTSCTSPGSIVSGEGWKVYEDKPAGLIMEYPSGTILPSGNCDTFVVPSDEKERKAIMDIKKSGQEIGRVIEGLNFGYCEISKENLPDLERLPDFLGSGYGITETQISGFPAREVIPPAAGQLLREYYVQREGRSILRIWYSSPNESYRAIAEKMKESVRLS